MDAPNQKLNEELVPILAIELRIYRINRLKDGQYEVKIGDQQLKLPSLSDCATCIEESLKEVKAQLYECWKKLARTCHLLVSRTGRNIPQIENTLLLSNLKRTYELAGYFSDLEFASAAIQQVFYKDITQLDPELVSNVNDCCTEIRCFHSVVMRELYRLRLIKRFQKLTKTAQVSGPWSNLDLPAAERMWDYEEDEEYFANRRSDRRAQTRYNPEYTTDGYYLVWQDYSRDPYLFGDKDNSPYKSRDILTIP